MVFVLMVLAWLQSLCILAFDFNPFDSQKLKKRHSCFASMSNGIFYGAGILELIIPVIICIYICAIWSSNNINDSFLRLPLLFYILVLASDLIQRAIIQIAFFKWKCTKEPDKEFEDKPYEDEVTMQGSGPRRMGSFLSFGEDIYSMLYVACLNSDYHFYNQHVIQQFPELKEMESHGQKSKDTVNQADNDKEGASA